MKIKKQLEIKDCGIYVVQALHRHFHNEWIKEEKIKQKAIYGSDGINMFNLMKLMEEHGIKTDAFDATVEEIIKGGTRYYVALISSEQRGHYVIIKYTGQFHIYDSIKGHYKMTEEEFAEVYLGSIIQVDIKKYKSEKINLDNPFKYLSKNWNVILWIAMTLLLSICFIFSSSTFMKIIVDKIIPGKMSKALLIVCISFAFLAILRVLNNVLRNFLVKKLKVRLQNDLTYMLIEKINSVNYNELSKITNNDLLRRFGLIEHVSGFMANSIFVVCNELLMLGISTTILIWISPPLFSLTFAGSVVILITTLVFKSFSKSKYAELIPLELKSFNSYIDMINLVKINKDFSNYKINKDKFEKVYEQQKVKDMELFNLSNFQHLIEEIIMYVIPMALVYFGAKQTFDQNMSVGSLLMFISVFHHFVNPLKDIATLLLHLPEQRRHIKLISFIMNMKDEKLNVKGHKIRKVNSISFSNSSIGHDRELFEIKELNVNASTQIIGPNGSGKSTLLNTISTLIKQKGQMKINNVNVEHLNLTDLRNKVIYIDPLSYVPEQTTLSFITDSNIDRAHTFAKCIEKYKLNEIFDYMDISFDTSIENDGKNISSGQRQLIFLMKLFTRKFDIVLLDEAFENIDTKTFNKLKKYIFDFQDAIFIEVSHSKKYVDKRNEVNIEEFN